jgi:hypothetical protein
VGAQVDQTNLEIEHIARTFYAARHESADWDKASRVLKHEYRLYARQALQMLERCHEQVRQEERRAFPAQVLEDA